MVRRDSPSLTIPAAGWRGRFTTSGGWRRQAGVRTIGLSEERRPPAAGCGHFRRRRHAALISDAGGYTAFRARLPAWAMRAQRDDSVAGDLQRFGVGPVDPCVAIVVRSIVANPRKILHCCNCRHSPSICRRCAALRDRSPADQPLTGFVDDVGSSRELIAAETMH